MTVTLAPLVHASGFLSININVSYLLNVTVFQMGHEKSFLSFYPMREIGLVLALITLVRFARKMISID
jgi:hypothetical protein